jgi:hypothetical protein
MRRAQSFSKPSADSTPRRLTDDGKRPDHGIQPIHIVAPKDRYPGLS